MRKLRLRQVKELAKTTGQANSQGSTLTETPVQHPVPPSTPQVLEGSHVPGLAPAAEIQYPEP